MADAAPSDTPSNGSQGDPEGALSLRDGSQQAESQPTEGDEQGIGAERPASSAIENAEDNGDGDEGGEGEDEEEEAGECGFCLFMKSGPCRDSFIKWENCVEQAEKAKEDIVEKCHKVTFVLKECMEQNSDYYEPVLQAEKAMSEEAEAEAAESARPDGEEEKPSSSSDSSEQPSLNPAQDQYVPEPADPSLPAPEHPSSE
ncbi:hypothetical protein L7F22_001854 [Adiantum nelumboides]|nr:hypothetical protein [Adiantum nelumboides]